MQWTENSIYNNEPVVLDEVKDITAAKILIIDDEPSVTDIMKNILRFDGFKHIESMADSRGALALFIEYEPDIVLLDLRMPNLDGFALLRLISERVHPSICLPIIVVSGEQGLEAKTKALSNGAIDYVTKPFIPDEVCLRVRAQLRSYYKQLSLLSRKNALHNEVNARSQVLKDYQLELKETQLEIMVRLARAAEHRDDDTGQHTQRVGLSCFLTAQELGLPNELTASMRRAAPLHDVGKIGVPDSILRKPGKLNAEEWRVMQSHCSIGASLLSGGRSSLLKMAESIAMSHHERWEGGGYPRGLKGEDIPIEGRVIAVSDVFDALVHDRPYKNAWEVDDALAEIKSQRGRQFDPDVVDAFMTLPHAQLV